MTNNEICGTLQKGAHFAAEKKKPTMTDLTCTNGFSVGSLFILNYLSHFMHQPRSSPPWPNSKSMS